MIEQRIIDELSCPIVVCDYCHRPIGQSGNVVWRHEGKTVVEGPFFLHKPCDTRGGYYRVAGWSWEELTTWMKQVTYNVNRPPNSAAQANVTK